MNGSGEFLKKRAIEFWERADEDLQKGRYNLSVLDMEQAVQLWLKYLIYLKAADFPKIHYFDNLISNLSEIYESKDILSFYEEHILEFRSLEDAYITSRYFPREFNSREVERIKEFVETFLKFLAGVTGEKFI